MVVDDAADATPADAPGDGAAVIDDRARLRLARQILREHREREASEKAFSRSVTATLKEAQDAINISYGAITSAYVGNVLASIDIKTFNHANLAFFFIMLTIFIGGLLLGNSALLKQNFLLGVALFAIGCGGGAMSLMAAGALGFETAILQVCYVSWVTFLLASDGVLTLVIYIHHHRGIRT